MKSDYVLYFNRHRNNKQKTAALVREFALFANTSSKSRCYVLFMSSKLQLHRSVLVQHLAVTSVESHPPAHPTISSLYHMALQSSLLWLRTHNVKLRSLKQNKVLHGKLTVTLLKKFCTFYGLLRWQEHTATHHPKPDEAKGKHKTQHGLKLFNETRVNCASEKY